MADKIISAPAKYNQIGKNAKSLDLEVFSRSRVNIIIPFHGNYEMVTKLVESILALARSNPYQICLVDDASPNKDYIGWIGNSKYGKAPEGVLPQVVTIRSEHQVGFGAALKLGYNATEQPWVMFMHSDCLVEDGDWMIEMGRSLLELKSKNVRMVSAMSNGNDICQGVKGSKDRDVILKTETLPLFCAMCHRDLFKHVGGFIKPYPFGWYEDEEFAFRMRKRGFQQAICKKSWVRHEGGATFDTIWRNLPERAEQIMEENRQRCVEDIKQV